MGDDIQTNGFVKTKVLKLAKDWETLKAEEAAKIKEITDKFGPRYDDVLDSAEQIGMKRSTFRAVIKERDLLDKASKVNKKFAERFADQPDMIEQLDAVRLAAGLIKEDDTGE